MVCSICGGNHRKNQVNKETGIRYHDDIDIILDEMIKEIEREDKKSDKRKNTDYQCTELLCALKAINFNDENYNDINSIQNFINDNRIKIKCSDDIISKYIEDLRISLTKGTIHKKYLDSFTREWFNDIEYVYLTGKTYRDYPEIINLNKGYEDKKPNSDVYFKLKNNKWYGLACKQSKKCPCTNKVVELDNENLWICREKLLIRNGITKENYKKHRAPPEGDGKIRTILYNKRCIDGSICEYWVLLEKHIIDNKNYFINEVISSMCQGTCLPYEVYEYDGIDMTNTKGRELKKEKCDIRISEIFCWGISGPRKASKIWFDFMYDNKILYKLEVRFKGVYFGPGGQPQIFIYKESEEDIIKYNIMRDKYKSIN